MPYEDGVQGSHLLQKREKQATWYIPKAIWGRLTIFYVINSKFLKHNTLKKEMGKVRENLSSGAVNKSYCFYAHIGRWAKAQITCNLVKVSGKKILINSCW